MRISIIITTVGALLLLLPCPPAFCADPWGPVDTSAGVTETLFGDFSGEPVTTDDVLGAFWNGVLVGRQNIEYNGSNYYYPNMLVWAPGGAVITFRIWDESEGVEDAASPTYTMQGPQPFPPGGPAYQQDIQNEGPIPEPPTIVILGLALALLACFHRVSRRRSCGARTPAMLQ